MSVNAKNLSYGQALSSDCTPKVSNREVESNEPTFLRRLRFVDFGPILSYLGPGPESQ